MVPKENVCTVYLLRYVWQMTLLSNFMIHVKYTQIHWLHLQFGMYLCFVAL